MKIKGKLGMKCGYEPCGGRLDRVCICGKGYACGKCRRCRFCSGDYKTAKQRRRERMEGMLSQRKEHLKDNREESRRLRADIARLKTILKESNP